MCRSTSFICNPCQKYVLAHFLLVVSSTSAMSSVSYEAFLDDSFSPDAWVQARPFFSFAAAFFNSPHVVQAVLEQAATSGAPETFIQTVVTKLFLLSNDANSSLDVAAHALQVHSCGVAI